MSRVQLPPDVDAGRPLPTRSARPAGPASPRFGRTRPAALWRRIRCSRLAVLTRRPVSLLLLARCRADEAALAEAGGEAGLARLLGLSGGGAAGIDPRPRASVAAFLIDRLGADPARSGLLEAAVRRAGEGSPGAAPPSAAPMLEAALATGLVSLESA